MTEYQKGLVDAIAGMLAAIFDECDEELLSAVFKKLNIRKVEDD